MPRRHRNGRRIAFGGDLVVVLVWVIRAVRVVVLVHDDQLFTHAATAQPASALLDPGEDEHPAAPHTEVAPVPHQAHDHVEAEDQQRDADNTRHRAVDPRGQLGR